MTGNVDHPKHYGGADNPYECIKVLEAWLTSSEFIGFLKGNSIKYKSRHRQKGGLEDLEKSLWYDERLVAFCKENGLDGKVEYEGKLFDIVKRVVVMQLDGSSLEFDDREQAAVYIAAHQPPPLPGELLDTGMPNNGRVRMVDMNAAIHERVAEVMAARDAARKRSASAQMGWLTRRRNAQNPARRQTRRKL